ncbi:MAG: ATP-binding cassette domain-containing protein [Bacilli bacterium]|nr:ATP-binding cassette domain-containing protein [Bacilli bacterium]
MKENKFEGLKNEKIDSFISLKNINKVYPNGFHAVYDFNLDIKENEFIVFVGPSGCGKSTTLRMIAGLEDITAGDLYINKIYSNNLGPKDRDVAMVFQNYALYPHMSVYDNIGFGLKMRHYPKEEIDEKVHKAAEILDLTNLLDRKPKQLSGGQMQRVALGRAIVRDANIFLMDEPLSNLDAKLRVKMRSEIIKLHQLLKTTSIYVTHDQVEAMTMATRIVVMSKGYVQQIGTPEEIYAHPANKFVASFIGTPAMNIYTAHYDIEKGVLALGDGKDYTLPKATQETIVKFFKDQIEALEKRIENIDYEVQLAPHQITKEEKEALKRGTSSEGAEYGSDFESSVRAHQTVSNAVLKGSNKFSFKTMFKKNKLPTYEEVKEKLLAEIEELIKQYNEYLVSGFDIDLGIRPDDIIYAENKDRIEHPGPAISLTSTVNELLGNEYYIHTDYQGIDLICKASANKKINSGDAVELVFDMDKIHLFDKLSEKAII